ncbi:glucose 1-dehydrogenase [Labrenzia sp. DG1229]|uniref:SDR family NAD(P)-dependent oxidoreductase n=1 Tax=Labrenzia sp. DG1229 TaxID=681847 RepID=UPI00048DB679|nr:glucose 1-dehydrogenase [Labrenzia sp. DG1229]
MNVDGLRFVITGASHGIGAETARLAASHGAKVAVSDIDDEAGEALVGEIRAAGGTAIFVHCDVTDEAEVTALMDATAKEFGGIDVLHNNAGVHEASFSSDIGVNTSMQTFDRVMKINLYSVWMCALAALPYLKKSDNASVINSGSIGSFIGAPSAIAYVASKGGVAILTKSMAVEFAPFGIRANCYCPATVETKLVTDLVGAQENPQEFLNMLTETHLVGRIGAPVDVANLVCFLASKEAAFVNGVNWLIDGGALAWRATLKNIGME